MSAAGEAPADAPALTDEEILGRFQRSRNQPTSSQTLGFRVIGVSQETMSVEVAFEARADLMLNPMKQIQGGYLCAMLDECMSVACMVASGMTNKEIAQRLSISVKTVETHRAQLMERLGVKELAGLVRSAIRLGLVTPER